MWFGLLGPLRVRGDAGGALLVTSGRQRVLLAALLMRPRQIVPADELVKIVWDGAPPACAAVTLRSYVKRLRQRLGADAGARIVTRPAGYSIEISDEELDIRQFADLCAHGISAARAAAWDQASRILGEALALWRGEPLADVPSDILHSSEAPYLEELRLEALESRIEADLETGHRDGLVSELQALAAGYPLRERFRAQLMLALYQSGRQAEALSAYRQAREMLVDELGIEPSPDLQDMHQRILTADQSLAGPMPAIGPRHRPPAVPRQLPVAIRHFTGRPGELAALSKLLDQAASLDGAVVISAIEGTAGIGKTALAVHWAHQVAERFPDGQLYLNLRGSDPSGCPVQVAEAVRDFIDAFGVPPDRVPASPEAQVGLYRSLLAERRVLIILDDAADADQVRPLLAGGAGCLVLITSRNQLTSLAASECADLITLDVLSRTESRELLAHRLGTRKLAAEPAAVDELITLCARLPLALAIAAARAAEHPAYPLVSLTAELNDSGRRLDALQAGDAVASVRAVFSCSYQSMDPVAARMFRLLGLHPGPDVSAQTAASLAGLTVAEARHALAELTRANLLAEHQPARFGFHDLLRAYAVERAAAEDSEVARRTAVGRALDYYACTGWAAALLLNPVRLAPVRPVSRPAWYVTAGLSHNAQALAWFEAEHKVLLRAIAQAASSGFDGQAWQISWSLADYFDRRGLWHDWVNVQHTAVAAAARLGDRALQASAHRVLGRAYTELGAYQDASVHFQRAIGLYTQLGDSAGQAYTLLGLARVDEYLGQYVQALDRAEQCLSLFTAIKDHPGQARAINAIGWFHAHLGSYGRALAGCQEALRLYQQLGDQRGEATTHDSLGYIHHQLGDYARALSSYCDALGLFQELDDRHNRAATLTRQGDTHAAAGNSRAARSAWEQALAILVDLQHPSAEQVRAKLELSGPAAG